MTTGFSTESSTDVNAPIEQVWRALTTPAIIKRWFLGVDTETDWQVGGPIISHGEYQGRPYEAKGVIVRFDPPVLLVHTHWSSVSGKPDSPEWYQEVSWQLRERDGATQVTVAERNLPSEELRAVSDRTWKIVLANLKQVVEGDRS